ncbi:uncharacterized protein [Asterias amurensis]|uniref:uncharacterized protein isoform X2 n=1 Tax=Asterias amurensis TaxID=7602 RepID=UPI003AB26B15
METGTRNVRLLDPATTPNRRSMTVVSSFKHGHNGRRTKLTNGLLRAISDIIEDTEILSISHLNQELLARGHSLSRSTVFRAMEILGMRMDRDKKRWCIGGSRVSLGVETRVSHLNKSSDEVTKSSCLPSATPPGGSLDETLLCETERGADIHSTGKLQLIPSQYNPIRTNPIPSNHSNSVGPTHQQNPRPSNRENFPKLKLAGSIQSNLLGNSTAAGERDSASSTKRFKTLDQPCPKRCGESDRCTKTSELHREVNKTLIDDGQTPSVKDRQHTYQVWGNVLESKSSVTSVMPRETGRSMSRKRKSDCPAKITPTSYAKIGAATKQGSNTVYGKDSNPQYGGHEQEYFNRTPQEVTPNFLPTSSGVPLLTDGSSQEVTTKGTCIDGSNRSRPSSREQEPRHLLEIQTRGNGSVQMPMETQTKQTKSEISPHKPRFRRVVIQNFQTQIQKNMLDEEDLCKNCTTSDSQEPESAKAVQRADQIPLDISLCHSQHPNTVDDKLSSNSNYASTNGMLNNGVGLGKNSTSITSKCRKLNQAPKLPQPRNGGHGLPFPLTELSQVEGCDSRLQPAHTHQPMFLDVNLKHRPLNHEQASRFLHMDESGTPSGLSDPEGCSALTTRPDGTDSQTARLHALTSSLAVKTSNRMTSQSPRWRKDVESVAPSRRNCQQIPSRPSTDITPPRNTTRASSEMAEHERRNVHGHVSSDAYSAQSTQDDPTNINEIQFWMQDISQKMTSMQQQLNYLTQVVTSMVKTEPSSNGRTNAMSPSINHRTTGDLEEQQVDGFSEAGDDDDDLEEEEEEEQAEMQRWGRNLPLINTPESEDMISALLLNPRWESLSPFVGGPRLAIQLARDCIFGPEVLMKSTVTGRNGMNPLHRDGIKKIKDCMMEIYGTRCSHVEFELLWKMARESLSQLCKRIRRRHIEVIGQEVNSQEVNGYDVESYGIIKPEME